MSTRCLRLTCASSASHSLSAVEAPTQASSTSSSSEMAGAPWRAIRTCRRSKPADELYQERVDCAREKLRLARLRRDNSLLWGNVRSLSYVTAGGNETFVLDLATMALIHGLCQSTCPSPLWKALQNVVTVVAIKRPRAVIDQVAESPDETAYGRKKLVGAAWEQFVMVGERVHSLARCMYPTEYSSVSLAKLLGQGAAYVGSGSQLQKVCVNAAIPHKRVWADDREDLRWRAAESCARPAA